MYQNQKPPENDSPKTSEKCKNQQLTEKQKSTENRNISNMGAHFLHLLISGGGSHRCTHVNHATVVDLCCIISPYKNTVE